MILISFICVNFKNHNVTESFIKSLEEQSHIGDKFSIQCIVVDNSDLQDEYEYLKKIKCNELDLLICNPKKNLGYFHGLNFGLKNALGRIIVICNNDLEFDRNFCFNLINKTFDNNVFAIAPNITTKDGYSQNPHVLIPIGWMRRLQMDIYYTNYYIARLLTIILATIRPSRRVLPVLETGREIHMGIGACYILTEKFFKNFKQLIYPHFLYGEEAYFSKQIHDAGGVLWYEPSLRVTHAESLSTIKLPKRKTYEFAKSGYSEYRNYL